MILPLNIFILVAVVSGAARANVTPSESRIVGGEVTTQFIPYQIALYISGKFSCGGSLITNSCVLTAGHCATGRAASVFKVRAGIKNLSSTGGVTRTVSKAIVHPQYNANTLNNDVAILKLSSAVSGTNIAPIALNSRPLYSGDLLTVSGWGLTTESGSVSDALRYVVVPAITNAKCNSSYDGSITKTMFCAGPLSGGKDSCSGDSGGPVVKNNTQYGIVSWGYGCARAGYPGVYTNVKQMLTWINQIKAANC